MGNMCGLSEIHTGTPSQFPTFKNNLIHILNFKRGGMSGKEHISNTWYIQHP